MTTLLLGFGIGLLAIVPLGPVSLSIIGVGLTQGRRAGGQAGIGTVGGDALACAGAVSIIGLGQGLPAEAFAGLRLVSLLLLAAFGISMIVGASKLQVVAERIDRPMPTMLLLTALSPLTVVAWLTLFIAMPFSSELGPLSRFALGGLIASSVWHPMLGIGAGALGHRLQPRTIVLVARVGGFLLTGFAAYLAINS